MIFDIAIYAMPIQILWHLNLPKRQRMGLVLVFALGFLFYLGTTVESLNWSSVEIHLALVLSCTVAFKTLIQRFLPGVLERASRSTKNIVSRGWPRGAKHDGDYVLQSVGHNESRANIATRGDSNEADEIGSQNPIVEDVEMAGLKGAASYRSLNSSIGDQVGSRQLPAEQGGW
uniref:Rhodopsin domain-containing protein n=1 Tax=Fusarium oxysporum (strain Fo5176) TaxID=660025 RepID=A0A0D2XTB3_FUSOF